MTRARDVANLIGSGNYSSTTFTATAGQTAFTISHTQGFVQVFMNGLLLDLTVDYTSNGSAITLTSGAAAGDEIEVVAYNTFSVGDALNQAAADTRYVNTSGDTMSGTLVASDGINLGGTGTANKLDDYEEGTWTPVLKSASNIISYTTNDAGTSFKYVKVGNLVELNFHIHNETLSGTSGAAFEIHNLPFTTGSRFRTTSGQVFNYNITFSQNNKHFDLNKSSTSMALRYQSAAGVYSGVNLTNTTGGTYMFFSITYFTD